MPSHHQLVSIPVPAESRRGQGIVVEERDGFRHGGRSTRQLSHTLVDCFQSLLQLFPLMAGLCWLWLFLGLWCLGPHRCSQACSPPAWPMRVLKARRSGWRLYKANESEPRIIRMKSKEQIEGAITTQHLIPGLFRSQAPKNDRFRPRLLPDCWLAERWQGRKFSAR